jgi:hypothetical protein
VEFYLGVYEPRWLERSSVPLFLSKNRFKSHKLPIALAPWALDSGGFTELYQYGTWRSTAKEYALEVQRFSEEIGNLKWAAPQDWMCEPSLVEMTGLSVAEHQKRTIANYLALRDAWPEGPFIPVLQGWEPSEYLAHVQAYAEAGIDLCKEDRVGVGSVARRQATKTAELIVRSIASLNIQVHGFGFKQLGIQRCGDVLKSSDSVSWSFKARIESLHLPGHSHRVCNNCYEWAMQWRNNIIQLTPTNHQLPML